MKTIRYTLLVFLTLNFQLLTFDSFSQTWQWAKHGGGTVTDWGSTVCQDSEGNVYMAGCYFDSPYSTTLGTFDSITIPYIGASQIFLVKYSTTGDVIWAKSIGGNDPSSSNPEYPSKVLYEPVSNAIYLSGKYNNTMVLGNDTLSGSGFFYAKLSTGGSYIWAKKLNNTTASLVNSDSYGNIYIAGGANATTTFDTVSVQPNYFIAKFNSSGICLKVNSNLKFCSPINVNIKNGNLYVLGKTTNDTVQLDTLVANFPTIYNSFVTRFDENLHLKWAKFMTSSSLYTMVSDICTDSLSNSYIVGTFQTDIDFDTTTLTTSGPNDLFIAKYDSTGVFQWARQGFNTTGSVYSPYISSLPTKDFYIAGSYQGNDLKLGNFLISTATSAYIARYNSTGNCSSVVTVPGGDGCRGISVDSNGNFSIIGNFGNPKTFGSYTVTSYGFTDVYVAKHDMLTGHELKTYNPKNELVIYANPNAGKCTITIPEEFKNETKLTLQIIDNTGHLLQQTPVEMMQDRISVNITAEAKGMYTAVLSNGVKSYTGKIIFE